MGKSKRRMYLLASSAAAVTVGMLADKALATNYTWANTGTGKWELATSWTAGTGFPSTTADVAIFGATSGGVINPNLTAGESISEVSIVGTSGALFTFSGSALSLSSAGTGSTTSAIVDRGNGGSNVFNNNVVLALTSGIQSFFTNTASSNTLVFNNTVSSNGAALALVGNGNFFFNNANNSLGGGVNIGSLSSAPLVNFVNGGLGSTGNIAFNGGTLIYESGNTQDISGRILSGVGPINLDLGVNAVTYASAISSTNTNGLVVASTAGTGSLALNAANAYTGGTTLVSGTVILGNAAALSSGNITFKGGTVAYASGITQDISSKIVNSASPITVDVGVNNVTFANAISSTNTGGFSLITTGTSGGSLSLNAANAYTGNTTLGTTTSLKVGNAGALGSGILVIGGTSTLDNGSGSGLSLTNGGINLTGASLTFTGTNNLTIGGTGAITGATRTLTVVNNILALTGNIADDGSSRVLGKAGAGTLLLAGTNTFGGGVSLTAGQLDINSNGALGSGVFFLRTTATTLDNTSSSSVVLSNGINQIAGTNFNFIGTNNLSFNGAVSLIRDFTITIGGSTLALNGNISQSSTAALKSFSKFGAGTLTLGGVNTAGSTFADGITVAAGGLNVNNNAALGNGVLTMAAGTTLDNTSGSSVLVGNAVSLGSSVTFTGSNALSVSGAVALAAGGTSISANANVLTLSGAVSGAAAVVKQGSGALALSGNNTFSGGISLTGAGGVVDFNSNTAAGTGTIYVVQTSTGFDNTSSSPVVLSNATNWNTGSNINFVGTNNLTFSGADAFTRSLNLTVSGSTLAFTGNITQTATTGTNWFRKVGGGTLTLSGVNTSGTTFADGVSLAAGQLNVNNSAALGNGTLFIASGTSLDNTSGSGEAVANNVSIISGVFTVAGTNDLNLSGTISGAGGFTKSGLANLTISGSANTYAGAVSVAGGTLVVGSTAAFGAASSLGIGASGVLDLNGFNPTTVVGTATMFGRLTNSSTTAAQYAGSLSTAAPGSTAVVDGVGDITLSGAVGGSNSSSLTKNGNNTLVLAGSASNGTLGLSVNAGTVLLSKTGGGNLASRGALGVVIAGGSTVRYAASDQLYEGAGGVAVQSGTLDIGAYSDVLYSLQLGTASTSGTVTGSTGVLSFLNTVPTTPLGTNSATLVNGVLAGIIGGTTNVTKTTALTTVKVSSANTYTGFTNVTGGTLDITSGGGLAGSTSVSVSGSGSVLELDPTSVALNQYAYVEVDSSGKLDLEYSGTETVAGLTLDGVALANGTYSMSSAAVVGSGNTNTIGSYFAGGGSLTVMVPEPTSIGMLGLAGGALLTRRRRRVPVAAN